MKAILLVSAILLFCLVLFSNIVVADLPEGCYEGGLTICYAGNDTLNGFYFMDEGNYSDCCYYTQTAGNGQIRRDENGEYVWNIDYLGIPHYNMTDEGCTTNLTSEWSVAEYGESPAPTLFEGEIECPTTTTTTIPTTTTTIPEEEIISTNAYNLLMTFVVLGSLFMVFFWIYKRTWQEEKQMTVQFLMACAIIILFLIVMLMAINA